MNEWQFDIKVKIYKKTPRTYEETHGESNKKMTIHVYHSAINFTI